MGKTHPGGERGGSFRLRYVLPMSPARNPDSSPAPSAMATLNKMVKNGLFFMKSTPFDSLEYVIPASLYEEAGIFAELDKKICKKLFKTTKMRKKALGSCKKPCNLEVILSLYFDKTDKIRR